MVAAIAGDLAAADAVALVLPETGICFADPASVNGEGRALAASCCGGPAPAGSDACCRDDLAAKAAGEEGCGCSSSPCLPVTAEAAAARSCCGAGA